MTTVFGPFLKKVLKIYIYIIYILHKPARRHYKRNRVIVGGIDELWQMDLADMQAHAAENDGYRYLLVCIDVFSKYVWYVPDII